MAEYIEREALNKIIDREIDICNSGMIRGELEYLKAIVPVAADVVEVKRGRWKLEVHKEPTNCRWNVTAECPFCKAEKKEIWAGLFPTTGDGVAESIAMGCAESVKLSNFCLNCGADMREGDHG